jgi:hypothetical protein
MAKKLMEGQLARAPQGRPKASGPPRGAANHAQRGAWGPSVHSIQCVNDSATRVVWKVFTRADSSA